MRRRRGVCVESWGADAGGLTTDAGTLRMQDFLTRGTSCSGRALIRCHSRKTRPSCRSGSNIRSVAAASAALTTDCPRFHRNPAFWAHRLVYKAGKATLPPCCTQPEVKKQTISHDIARLSSPGLRQFPPPSGCPMPLWGELPRMAEHPCADPAENAARQGETSLFRFRRPTNTKPNPSAVQNPHSKYTG